MPTSVLGKIALIFSACLLIGPLFGAMPVVAWATFIDVTGARYSPTLDLWGLLKFPGNFLEFFLGGYAFEFAFGFAQSIIVGLVYCSIGFVKGALPAWSMVAAFGFSIAVGVVISLEMLVCQCHRNFLGHIVYEPIMFPIEYIFLAVGCWLLTRKVWSSET